MFLGKVLKNPDLMLFSITVFIFIFYMANADFINIEILTFGYFFLFSFFFSVFFRFSLIFTSKLRSATIKPLFPPQFLYFIAILFAMLSLSKLLMFLLVNGFHSFMIVRTSVSGSNASLSLGVGLSFPLSLAAWYVSKASKSKLETLFLFLSFLLAIISTSKVFLFVFVFYVLYFSKVDYFRVLIAISALLLLFVCSHLLLEKFSSDPEQGVLSAIWNTFRVYLLGGVAAFQNIINGYASLNEYVMFTSIKRFLEQFGVLGIPADPILPWTVIGKWNTNVYTAFGYWFSFFGVYFLFFCSFLLGVLYAVVFSKVESSFFEFYKPFLLFCLSFIFMGDQFIPALTMHFIYLTMCIVISAVYK